MSSSAELARKVTLEGTVIDDLRLPLPGDLRDLSKAAAMVSGVVEDRIPALLNDVRSETWDKDGAYTAFEFRRETIGFPDILLVERADPSHVIFQIEAKTWYILASDTLTARFLTSTKAIPKGTLVIIVAWLLDGVVSGHPKLLRVYTDDAIRLATVRDKAWSGIDADHRVVVTPNVGGDSSLAVTGEIRKGGRWVSDADNFGKLDRLYDPELQAFKTTVLGLRVAGRTLREWQTFIKTTGKI